MENFVTSKKLIKEIIRNFPQQVSKLYIANNAYGKDIEEIINLAKSKQISFLSVPKQKILNIFNQGYSGFLLVLSSVKYFYLDEFIENIKLKSKCCVLILDEIIDPQNFGAILRTAAAFEIDAVIIQQWNQALVTHKVTEISRGGVYLVPIVKVKNVYNAVKKLKEINFWIYATMPQKFGLDLNITSVKLKDIRNQQYIAIVLGNEEKGIRKNIVSECDGIITIEHSQHIESLNVSVVCGIVLYELKN